MSPNVSKSPDHSGSAHKSSKGAMDADWAKYAMSPNESQCLQMSPNVSQRLQRVPTIAAGTKGSLMVSETKIRRNIQLLLMSPNVSDLPLWYSPIGDVL